MSTQTQPAVTAHQLPLDMSDKAFGFLRSSEELLSDPAALRARLEEDGYLFIRNFLPKDLVHTARMSILQRLNAAGHLDPSQPLAAGVCNPDKAPQFSPSLANPNPDVERVVFGPELLGFYTKLFGGPIRHFDYIWARSVGPGIGTSAHCDLVYMGRGTHRLLTCWVPYGPVPLEQSPLMLLEDSHKKSDRIKSYLEVDVDSYCENRPDEVQKVKVDGGWAHPGWLSQNCVTLREKFGGRWLTANYQPGDFITFPMNMVHASLDNATDRVRLSTDTRYQLASEPIDERWIGNNPAMHGRSGKRGRIC